MQGLFHYRDPSHQSQAPALPPPPQSSITLQDSQYGTRSLESQLSNTSKVIFLTGKFLLLIHLGIKG